MSNKDIRNLIEQNNFEVAAAKNKANGNKNKYCQ